MFYQQKSFINWQTLSERGGGGGGSSCDIRRSLPPPPTEMGKVMGEGGTYQNFTEIKQLSAKRYLQIQLASLERRKKKKTSFKDYSLQKTRGKNIENNQKVIH